MARPVSPLSWFVLMEVLGDDEWHEDEHIYQRAMPTVPPGDAIRISENRRRWKHQWRGKNEEELPPPPPPPDQVRAGQREAVTTTLVSLARNNKVERHTTIDGNKYTRRAKPFRLDQKPKGLR